MKTRALYTLYTLYTLYALWVFGCLAAVRAADGVYAGYGCEGQSAVPRSGTWTSSAQLIGFLNTMRGHYLKHFVCEYEEPSAAQR